MAVDSIITFGPGKDYSDFPTLRSALMSMDLVATGTRAVVELSADVVGGSMNFFPASADQDCYILFRPASGMGHADLDHSGALDFGTVGVGFVGGYWLNIGAGIVFEGVRIYHNHASESIFVGNPSGPTIDARSEFRRCKILLHGAGSRMYVSINGRRTNIYDSLIISENPSMGPVIQDYTHGGLERSTIIRRGDAVGKGAGYLGGLSDNANAHVYDTVFIGCGDSPINAEYGNFSNGARLQKNYSDTPLATNIFTQNMVYSASMVVNGASDYRLHALSPAIGGATANAENTLDVRENSRGLAPDAGCVQSESAPVDPPTATVTDQSVPDGQTVTITLETTDAASGTITFTGSDGGETRGVPFDVENDAAVVVAQGLAPGHYELSGEVTGLGGTDDISGLSGFDIVPVSGGGPIKG